MSPAWLIRHIGGASRLGARLAPDIMTPAAIAAMPAGPDKVEVMFFYTFLRHHGRPTKRRGSAICSCGVAARLDGDVVRAVPNPDCPCPCHEPGYAVA